MAATTFLGLPRDASPRLKAIHIAQISVVTCTGIATFLTAIIPQKHKAFTFSLLYTLILTSFTTTFLLRKEQIAANKGQLTKDKYVKYQLFKIFAAFVLSIVGFFASFSVPHGTEKLKPGQSGFVLNGYRVNTWQGCIIWLSVFNWLFLWASLFYSCCMTGNKQGAIALAGEEANIGIQAGDENDEALARRLQAEDPNWES